MLERYLIFVPSLSIGLIAALWLRVRPSPYLAVLPLEMLIMLTALFTGTVLGAGYLLQRYSSAYAYATQLLTDMVRPLKLGTAEIVVLAGLTGLSEELFFRGALLPVSGVWLQALVFGLLHPATRKGWVYTVFTFGVGLLFGYGTAISGSIWPAVVSHSLINAVGFFQLRHSR
jgi:membrane protease YdiL (CAAX protease family)